MKDMLRIGCHLSVSKGFLGMGRDAVSIGANTFQFFTRNPRGGAAKVLNLEDVAAFNAFAEENDIRSILAHASYTLNPASPEQRLIDFVRQTMADDFDRLSHLPGAMYNFHPGSDGKRDRAEAIRSVVDNLNAVLQPKQQTIVLLETMSGGGSEVGGAFGELRRIIDAVKRGELLGVCLDTCHVFAAGFDVVNDLDGVIREFDKAVGLERLRAIHLNDSMFPLGSHKDRHAGIGKGCIGMEAFGRIVNHPALRDLPFYLETPNDLDGWAKEIAALRKLYGKKPAAKAPAKKAAKGKAAKK
jgi:deoxyribonuclease-4